MNKKVDDNFLNFCFIGPDKSGSTWLFEQFLECDQVSIPQAKDIYFFDKNYYKGLDWYKSYFSVSDFTNSNNKKYGEVSHDYIFSEIAIKRMHNTFPNLKIITIIRNPIEKLISHYLFLKRNGLTIKTLEEAINEFPELLEKSIYSNGISKSIELYGEENVGVFFFEELQKSPEKLIIKIYKFLSIDCIPSKSVLENPLPASNPRVSFLARFAKISAMFLRRIGWLNFLGKIKRNKLIKFVLYKKVLKKPQISVTLKKDLLKKYYLKEISTLENLLSVDLEHWREL